MEMTQIQERPVAEVVRLRPAPLSEETLLILCDEIQPAPSAFHHPRILTNDLVGRLAECNAAVRALRVMGFKVKEEDPVPNDGGRPILLLSLNGQPLTRLLNHCDASTTYAHTERVSALFQGVRLIVEG